MSTIITTSTYVFGSRPLDCSIDVGGDENLIAHDILIVGNKSENKTNLIET